MVNIGLTISTVNLMKDTKFIIKLDNTQQSITNPYPPKYQYERNMQTSLHNHMNI